MNISIIVHLQKSSCNYDEYKHCKLKIEIEIEQQNWPKLYNAINSRDVSGIASNVHRKDVGWIFFISYFLKLFILVNIVYGFCFFSLALWRFV